MTNNGRSPGFWIIVVFLAVSVVLMLVGQTLGVFNYELAARMGLQEKPEEMTEFGVQVNRAFGAADTVVYIPLMVVSIVGLMAQKALGVADDGRVFRRVRLLDGDGQLYVVFLPGVPGYATYRARRSGSSSAPICSWEFWALCTSCSEERSCSGDY